MFALTPLAVALQGLGYGSFLSALQGLAEVTVAPADIEPTPPGALAPVKVRHRTRRWSSFAAIPTPWEALFDAEREDEELLFEIGVF